MDSVTQLVTGALLAAAVVPAKHRRAALWAGAALGTLPDLDVLPLSLLNDDPVLKMTAHRSITHSLLVLPWVALLIWWWCKRSKGRVAEAPQAWWWAIFLALVNHPLLDCFNAYGTWLFWPLGEQAIMWGNMFVIDPLFTLPLLLGFVWVAFKPKSKHSSKVIYGAIGMSMVYFAWSLAAQMWVMQKVDKQLADLGLQDAPRLVTATPFNTLVWQVLVLTPDGVLSGSHSISQDDAAAPLRFQHVASDVALLPKLANNMALQRLQRFNQGYFIVREVGGKLIISDVRMGREPHYTFNFAIAQLHEGTWQELTPPEQIQDRPDIKQEWGYLQKRLWGE